MTVKPSFYDKFACIAGACDFTCCMQWKIGVDEDTARTWKRTAVPPSVKTRRKELLQFTQFKDGQRVISLENGICPFLDEEKLCRLVKEYGDGILSKTCQEFPRERHVFSDRTEFSLMPCCPAVVDLIREAAADLTLAVSGGAVPEYRLERIRAYLMELMQERALTCEETMLLSFYLLQELVRNESLSIAEAKSYEDEILQTIRTIPVDEGECFAERLELFYDLTDNYHKQGLYRDLLDPLYETADQISEGESCGREKSGADFKQVWNSYDRLLHGILWNEIYSDLLQEEARPEDLQIRYQWIAMEYVLIRMMCELHFRRTGTLSYEEIRTYIVLASRMMGYEEADIYEYLENSFEELLWEWGYFALIVGK